jgi:uncharacterized protein with NRDE domain
MNDVNNIQQVYTDLSERICIPKFEFPIESIKESSYATRTSTVVLVDHENRVTFVERDWHDENLSLINTDYNDIIYHFNLE